MSHNMKTRNNTVHLTTYGRRIQITKLEKDSDYVAWPYTTRYISLSKDQASDLVRDLRDWLGGKLEEDLDVGALDNEWEVK
jgi:hypothetical protein